MVIPPLNSLGIDSRNASGIVAEMLKAAGEGVELETTDRGWMGCACQPWHELQCPELCVGQWSVQWGVWRAVGVHKGSVLSPLLFILVSESLSREFCTGVPWELLYADDLVLIADTQEECISKLKSWKTGMESKGLHVNMKTTKFLVSGDGPCAVCSSGVGRNSILCSQYMLRVHMKCSAITEQLVEDSNYACPRCKS